MRFDNYELKNWFQTKTVISSAKIIRQITVKKDCMIIKETDCLAYILFMMDFK